MYASLGLNELKAPHLNRCSDYTVNRIALAIYQLIFYLHSWLEWANIISKGNGTKVSIGVTYMTVAWWRHQMVTFSPLPAICAGNSPVTGEFPTQRPVTRSFDVFFDLRLNKRLNKQSWGWWFEMPSRPIWGDFIAWLINFRSITFGRIII